MNGEFEQLSQAIAECAARSPVYLTDDDLIVALDACQVAVSQVAGLRLTLVRELDGRGVATVQGATSTKAWLHGRYLYDPATAARLVGLAADLDTEAPLTQAGLAAGEVNDEQAQVICKTLTELPDDVDSDIRDKAEAHLVAFAATFDPKAIRRLGRRILETVDPQGAQRREAELLAKQEERAYAARSLTLRPDHLTGGVRVSGWLDTEGAATVAAALDPLCAPGHGVPGVVDDRTPGQRRADALTDICRLAMTAGELPDNGGDRPQLTLMADYDILTGHLSAATLDTGQRLSPDSVRRLACDCGILPAIMNGTGQVLDLGRERRLWTGPARKAILLRDGGCSFPGCDRPPCWVDIHHIQHWTHGGATNRDNGVALCGHHHRVIHLGHWAVKIASDGLPEFTPPAYVDRQQAPLRNTYHRRP